MVLSGGEYGTFRGGGRWEDGKKEQTLGGLAGEKYLIVGGNAGGVSRGKVPYSWRERWRGKVTHGWRMGKTCKKCMCIILAIYNI